MIGDIYESIEFCESGVTIGIHFQILKEKECIIIDRVNQDESTFQRREKSLC